jgi:[acyl-carrier-protein] S-malonyltransferase
MIEPANYNCPGQVVLSLERRLLVQAKSRLGPIVKKVVELPVSGGFHSALMREAQVEFSEYLAEIPVEKPRIPLLLSVIGIPSSEPEEIRRALTDQMTSPVRWQEMVEHMASLGVRTFVEIGPKDVLSGLIRRIARDRRVVPTDGRDLPDIVSQLACGGNLESTDLRRADPRCPQPNPDRKGALPPRTPRSQRKVGSEIAD